MQGQPPSRGNIRQSYKLDKLTPDDILHQIYCLRKWFLYLTKDEHLQKNRWERLGNAFKRLGTHHLRDLLLVLVFLLLLTHFRRGGCCLLCWCHIRGLTETGTAVVNDRRGWAVSLEGATKRHVYYMCTCRLRVFVLPHPTNSFLGKEMAPTKTLAALAVSGIGILAYAIYFDYRRRTDANFRKQLRMLVLLVTLVHSFYGLARTGKEET